MKTPSSLKTPLKHKTKAYGLLAVGLLAVTFIVASTTGAPMAAAAVPGGASDVITAGDGSVTLAGKLDRTAVMQGTDGQFRMELTMTAEERAAAEKIGVPTDLIVVLDRSSSMHGEKFELARRALHEIIARLTTEDRFGLVTYSDVSYPAIPLATANGDARAAWRRTIDDLYASGSTNMSAGLDTALNAVEGMRRPGRQPRVILISDGQANTGDASPAGLRRRALRASRGEYVLSTVGVGADFNESLMTSLADAGTGNYYFLERSTALASVFKDELDSAKETVASGVAVRIVPKRGVTVVDAAGYPLEYNKDASVTFRPGSLFSGQQRKVWVTFSVPTASVTSHELGEIALDYADNGKRGRVVLDELPRIACVEKEDEFIAAMDKDTWERSVLVDEYNALQQQVAESVRKGEKEQAMQAIKKYRQKNKRLNRKMGSVRVNDNLMETEKLQRDVEYSFEGDDQDYKQNIFSKSRGAAAFDGRRVGAKK